MIRQKALDLGFSRAGIASAEPLAAEGSHLEEWLRRGFHASMHWMERRLAERKDPAQVLPGARSVVSVAVNYYTPVPTPDDKAHGKVSRYAWGDDYHDVVGKRMEEFRSWFLAEFPGEQATWYVDTGPVMDKAWAQRAGIGWQGKHSNIISQEFGSWLFLGELITTLELDPDTPATDHCGTCTLCIDACPTGAIVEPYVVDSQRCLSYLTIEHRTEIPEELAGRFDGWVYGCDICQDVCPWNEKFAHQTGEQAFFPRDDHAAPLLDRWAAMSPEEFARKFKGSPMKRSKWSGLMRNIATVVRGWTTGRSA